MNEESLADYVTRLEQENKALKQEIDDLLEKKPDCNDEFGCQELITLKQENRELLKYETYYLDKYIELKDSLEEIRILATKNVSIENFVKIQNKINEVLNHSEG